MLMDMTKLKRNNPIEKITKETVATLTEPIQLQYLLLTLEQYNKIAEYFSVIGQTIVQNTDLISELPTYQDVNDLTMQEIRPYLADMRTMTAYKLNSIESSAKQALSKQTTVLSDQLQKELNRMVSQLKVRDLAPWKLRLKWMALGAILPLMVCILLLVLR